MEEKKGIKESKEMLMALMDAAELMLGEFKDGKKMIEEMKDLDMAEGIELAMLVMMRLPSLLDAMKKEPAA